MGVRGENEWELGDGRDGKARMREGVVVTCE